jgi:hypothetical protein
MKEYGKIVGCRVKPCVFEFIKKKDMSQSEYLRKLIYEDIKRSENNTNEDVNNHVNKKENKDIIDIHEKVDRILMRLNTF